MKERNVGFVAVVLSVMVFVGSLFSVGCSGEESGGRCRFCGKHTNWTYRSYGYVCYSCDKAYD